VIQQPELIRAYQRAMLPNPIEVGKYNMMADIDGEQVTRFFDQNHQAKIWAPIVLPNGSGSSASKPSKADIVNSLTSNLQALMGGAKQKDNDSVLKGLIIELANYVDLMEHGQGEDGEGLNVAVINDPFGDPDQVGTGNQKITGNPKFTLDPSNQTDLQKQVQTSWHPPGGVINQTTRAGYSVKLVTLKGLISGEEKPSSDAAASSMSNRLSLDSGDADKIQH
jgi:hypothetical protein